MFVIDKHCIACGRRISLAESELYGGHCSRCVAYE